MVLAAAELAVVAMALVAQEKEGMEVAPSAAVATVVVVTGEATVVVTASATGDGDVRTGGGGAHNAESPAKSRLRPSDASDPEYVTVKVTSM